MYCRSIAWKYVTLSYFKYGVIWIVVTYKIYSSWDTASNSVFSFVSTFVGPFIVIYFYGKTNQMHSTSNLFNFGYNTLHVSHGLSAHHQESKTVHTASYHTGSMAAC